MFISIKRLDSDITLSRRRKKLHFIPLLQLLYLPTLYFIRSSISTFPFILLYCNRMKRNQNQKQLCFLHTLLWKCTQTPVVPTMFVHIYIYILRQILSIFSSEFFSSRKPLAARFAAKIVFTRRACNRGIRERNHRGCRIVYFTRVPSPFTVEWGRRFYREFAGSRSNVRAQQQYYYNNIDTIM